jgi:HK97 family phage portal protein
VGWWARLWGLEQRDALTLEQLLADDTAPTFAGERVTADTAARHSAVWGCWRLLADTVSTLPLHAYRAGEPTPMTPQPPLLGRPSGDADLGDWLYMLTVSLLARGNAYGIVTARSGATLLPAQVDIVHPDKMTVTLDPSDGRVVYRLAGVEQDPADVWHVRAYRFPGSLTGLSPVDYARQAISLGLAAEKFGAQFFGDGSMPSGVIYTDGEVSEPAAKRLQAQWIAARKDNRKPAVIGKAKFEPLSIAPEESQFLESTKANVATICRYYGVPPEMMAAESGNSLTYANVEQRGLDFLVYSVRPWLVRLEHAISTLLPRNQLVKFNPDAIVRVTLKERYEAHKLGIEAGFLLKNEARELEDMPRIPGLDDQPPAPTLGGVA